jgi:hypothetical protein
MKTFAHLIECPSILCALFLLDWEARVEAAKHLAEMAGEAVLSIPHPFAVVAIAASTLVAGGLLWLICQIDTLEG